MLETFVRTLTAAELERTATSRQADRIPRFAARISRATLGRNPVAPTTPAGQRDQQDDFDQAA